MFGIWGKRVSRPLRYCQSLAKSSVPAVITGIILGPVAGNILDPTRWGSAVEGQQEVITLVCLILSATSRNDLLILSGVRL